MSVSHFGETSAGAPVREVTLRGGGLTARLIEWGCVLRDLRLDGVDRPLTLGLNSVADYEAHSPHMGAIAGRCANRIGGGRFTIDGVSWQATRNADGENTLHGGENGFGRSLWRLVDHGADHATFALTHAHLQEGFPGEITAQCRYRLAEGAVEIDLWAVADRPTLCNLAQHSYFNLSGADVVDDHILSIDAGRHTPLGPGLVPTGEVADLPPALDFRAPRRLGAQAVDLNYCLADARRPTPVAAATLSAGGVEMALETTEPGLQLYTGDTMRVPVAGLDGRRYGPRAGLCLEAQVWPDAANHAHFPPTILKPGETYAQRTVLRFRRERR